MAEGTSISLQNIAKSGPYYAGLISKEATSTPGTDVGSALVNGITRALPQSVRTNMDLLSNFSLGTFLARRGTITGNQASVINGLIDFMRDSGNNDVPKAKFMVDYRKNFIPIILRTEFNLDRTHGSPKSFYILFDSTPESISFNKSATWTQQPIYGRPEPLQIFQSSGPITFSLTGTFFSMYPTDHNEKLNLANRLFALTSPSKYHLLPSPVEVKIGEWKRLRCIVSQVKIDYKGPWWISSSSTNNEVVVADRTPYINQAANIDQEAIMPTTVSLPSHAPYIFEATFDFTVVSELNSVQFAEDIVDAGWNGGFIDNSNVSGPGAPTEVLQAYAHSIVGGVVDSNYTGGIIISNQPWVVDDTQWSNRSYLSSLGINPDSGSLTNAGALAQITSGLTAITTGYINNRFGSSITRLLGR